jgi:hypothetical protein
MKRRRFDFFKGKGKKKKKKKNKQKELNKKTTGSVM